MPSLPIPRTRGFAQSRTNARVNWRARFQDARFSQTARGYARQSFNYQRFQTSQNLLRRWAAQPTFYYQVTAIGGAGTVFYVYNLETVPVSGRRRFNVVSPETEQRIGDQEYQKVLREYGRAILPESSAEHTAVTRVLRRLLPHSGLPNATWRVHVIDESETNAFVLPGGKVFVFRGLLNTCRGDDALLAAVLSHEIAHNTARHAAEKMSTTGLLPWAAALLALSLGLAPDLGVAGANLAIALPHSRVQESEADYIGLMMMAEACYDPQAAVELWGRMQAAGGGREPPQFLSTHPSHQGRSAKISGWMEEALGKREAAGCQGLNQYVTDFTDLMKG